MNRLSISLIAACACLLAACTTGPSADPPPPAPPSTDAVSFMFDVERACRAILAAHPTADEFLANCSASLTASCDEGDYSPDRVDEELAFCLTEVVDDSGERAAYDELLPLAHRYRTSLPHTSQTLSAFASGIALACGYDIERSKRLAL